jgi:uncharacterized protein YceK
MKSTSLLLASLAVAFTLSGCGSVRQASHGSWLDHVGERQAARYPLTDEEKSGLQARAEPLRANAVALRVKLASEKDRVQRIAYMRELVRVDDELRPIEKALRDGGFSECRLSDAGCLWGAGA